MNVEDMIDKILLDIGDPVDGKGFWTRADVLSAINAIQQQITSEIYYLSITSEPVEIDAESTEVEFTEDDNVLLIYSAYRNYGGVSSPVSVYTEKDIDKHINGWRNHVGSLLEAIVIPNAYKNGIVRPYPLLDNDANDLVVDYYKIAPLSSDDDNPLEIYDVDMMTLENGVKSTLYGIEREGKYKDKAVFYASLYKDGFEGIKRRIGRRWLGGVNRLATR